MTRFDDKANAVVAAWQKRYTKLPSKHAVVMCCAVAEHETMCGDAWNHSGNWGAIQRRLMTDLERAAVKNGSVPPPTDPFEQLHGDSSPINGRYQTWFWAFPTNVAYAPAGALAGDEAGAWKLLEVLLDKRPSIKAIIDAIDVQTLASNMYHTHYYEGVHDPRQPGGVDKNIADYGHALSFTAGRFTSGLANWQPGGAAPPSASTPPPGTALDMSSVLGIQRALNRLAVVNPPLQEDGVGGPKTRDAIQLFQREHPPLAVDGVVGPKTLAALTLALP